jgi:hypothetical protein
MVHFHIYWSDSKLDWEAFQTREDATKQAKELVRPGETYVIEQFDGTCPRCMSLAVTTSLQMR